MTYFTSALDDWHTYLSFGRSVRLFYRIYNPRLSSQRISEPCKNRLGKIAHGFTLKSILSRSHKKPNALIMVISLSVC
jgi:hypothetical protein